MYKKYGVLLILSNMIVLFSFCSLKLIERNQFASTPVFQIQLGEDFQREETYSCRGNIDRAESGRRIIGYEVLERKDNLLSEEDFQVLCRIVEAEAGGEDISGKLLVANVILNRVEDAAFPDTVKDVVFQQNNGAFQFSPICDGRYYEVKISEETREAVQRALLGEDNSKGALYFASRKGAAPEKMKWFDTHLTRLFEYGGHEFFA